MVEHHGFHPSAFVEDSYASMPVYMRLLHVILDAQLHVLVTDELTPDTIERLSSFPLHANVLNLIDRSILRQSGIIAT